MFTSAFSNVPESKDGDFECDTNIMFSFTASRKANHKRGLNLDTGCGNDYKEKYIFLILND